MVLFSSTDCRRIETSIIPALDFARIIIDLGTSWLHSLLILRVCIHNRTQQPPEEARRHCSLPEELLHGSQCSTSMG
eukprot:COSAG02_NODE_25601_length_653_cov_1.633574_1_plen_76_part_01